ncbi:nuclease [Savitreella phatthalungensis]
MSSLKASAAVFAAGMLSGAAAIYTLKERQRKPLRLDPLIPVAPHAGNAPSSASEILRYGMPRMLSDTSVHNGFISAYDRRTRNPAWVAEHLTSERLQSRVANRGKSVFHEDETVPAKYRALLRDYTRSGYDRGHQVPAADCKFSQVAMDETFILTNICPQVGDGFNRDYWAHFEDFCRRLTMHFRSVRILTGPLYLPRQFPDGKWRVQYEVIGTPANVAVPTHFYKIIIADQGVPGEVPTVGAFVLPNAPIDNDTPLTDFISSVDAIERSSGLELLSAIPPNRRRSLCSEIKCEIVVRFFEQQAKL